MSYLFFQRTFSPGPGRPLPSGLVLAFWRPERLRLRPGGFPARPFLLWGCWHVLGVFRSRGYAIALLYEDGALVHRTCLLPAHYRFPFMRPGDLQAAGIWTRPDRRGAGLGLVVLEEVCRRFGDPSRTLWYMAREDNRASIRLAEKAGFRSWGRGRKRAWPGLGWLAPIRVTEGPAP